MRPYAPAIVAAHSLLPLANHPASESIPRITDDLNLPVSPLVNLRPAEFSLKNSSASADQSGSMYEKFKICSKLGVGLDNHPTA